ncbi:ABC transporter ATP-binding protein [Salinicoccus halitifaciens]|uniref:Iron complex transport system ATP-binding protein n=1 Tax=Salinicoccus halitifaciens TaxID=1073415 RepID=A0ABV2E811_9STAP|nr:ABC transporter ATP-binding protein [Salinicoccus halitifaciens]MCD2137695.1 ABC transporter ATP-binding protein [Salinicoccus halitifaciens]
MDKIIDIQNVKWVKSGQEILKDVSWSVDQGEHWAVLGLNGSGKTSLLNIVTGYNYPTKGSVTVLDTTFGKASIPEMRKKIGVVSTALERFDVTLNNQLVEDIVLSGKFSSFGIYQEVTDADREKAEGIMNDLRLDYLKGQVFRTLSQGEKRRTIIGRALMADPDLLILDEPCSGLDILSREDVLSITQSIRDRNSHLIYVTHHIEEITDVITHVLLMKDGEVVTGGRKEDVLTSANLSDIYKIPVKVHWENKRPWLSISSQ